MATDPSGHLALTDDGQSPELSYGARQARELGRAFGLAVAERTARNRFPDHMVSTLDAEAILLAGFARSGPRPSLGTRPRPDFFIEAWRPGERSRVFVVTVNGNHQRATKRTAKADRSAFKQLARASERAEHFHLAEWNTTPCLLTPPNYSRWTESPSTLCKRRAKDCCPRGRPSGAAARTQCCRNGTPRTPAR